jgi:hypothetical protein
MADQTLLRMSPRADAWAVALVLAALDWATRGAGLVADAGLLLLLASGGTPEPKTPDCCKFIGFLPLRSVSLSSLQ